MLLIYNELVDRYTELVSWLDDAWYRLSQIEIGSIEGLRIAQAIPIVEKECAIRRAAMLNHTDAPSQG